MVDGFRLSKYLNQTKLSAEEFWFLYRILVQEPTVSGSILKIVTEDVHEATSKFSMWSEIYHKEARIGGEPIDWKKVLFTLEDRGFIEIWSKNPEVEILLSEVKTTEEFKKEFLISDIRVALMEFVEIYPMWVFIQKTGSKFPSMNKNLDILEREYNEKILKGGNMLLHQRCLLITKMYLDSENKKWANCNMSTYFDSFEGIARAFEQGNGANDIPGNNSINIYTDE